MSGWGAITAREVRAWGGSLGAWGVMAALIMLDGLLISGLALTSGVATTQEAVVMLTLIATATKGVLAASVVLTSWGDRESTAFLRMLPLSDRRVVGERFVASLVVVWGVLFFEWYLYLPLVMWGDLHVMHALVSAIGVGCGASVVAAVTAVCASASTTRGGALIGVVVVMGGLGGMWALAREHAPAMMAPWVASVGLLDPHLLHFAHGRIHTGTILYIVGLIAASLVTATALATTRRDPPTRAPLSRLLGGDLAVLILLVAPLLSYRSWVRSSLSLVAGAIATALAWSMMRGEPVSLGRKKGASWLSVAAGVMTAASALIPVIKHAAIVGFTATILIMGLVVWVSLARLTRRAPRALHIHAVRRVATSALVVGLVWGACGPLHTLGQRHDAVFSANALEDRLELSSRTRQAIRALEEVEIVLFLDPTDRTRSQARAWLNAMERQGATVRVVDQIVAHDLAARLNVERNGVIALSVKTSEGPSYTRVEVAPRRDLDSRVGGALVTLGRPTRRVYLISDRRDDSKPPPLYALKSALDAEERIEVEVLDISELEERVPDDASALVMIDPGEEVSPASLDSISTYLEKEGAILIAREPLRPSFDSVRRLEALVGARVTHDPVVSVASHASSRRALTDRLDVVATRFEPHPATGDLSEMGETRRTLWKTTGGVEAVAAAERPYAITIAALVRAPDDAFLDEDRDLELDEGERSEGVPTLMMATTPRKRPGGEEAPRWRAIVLGDTNAIRDDVVTTYPDNLALATSAIGWLVDGDETIAPPRAPRRLRLTSEERSIVMGMSAAGAPALFMLAGVLFLWRRRRKREGQ